MENLVKRAQLGEQSAVEEIVEQYKGLIRSIANKFFLVGGDKDDLLQEGMLGLYFAIIDYDETKGNFHSFVTLCVRRRIINAVKKASSDKNKVLADALDITEAEEIADEHTPLSDLLEKESAERVHVVVTTQLTVLEKQVVELFAEGYTYEAIAEKLNKSFKAVDGALQRARKKLLENL